ncbi:hypothetical protein ALC62_09890 [Cyphomyrmex costatus]|uniref:Uncharacterized protein n=1 Tax=Cyphomyrmex costatus TaxID=456900 RepID=A0A151IFD2_9HYME|nr:hypothetical protein ALC62_09890 [Cyphomyrmex costatus]
MPRLKLHNDVLLGDAVVTNRDGKAYLRAFNTGDQELELPVLAVELEEFSDSHGPFDDSALGPEPAKQPSRNLQVMLPKCKTGNDFCIISFQCKHSTCAKFKFFVTQNIDVPHTDKIVHVYVNDHISHEKERHRHHIRGKVRAALTDELEKRSAIVVKLKMLANADEEVLRAGNLNKTPSLDILQKISIILFSEKQIRCLASDKLRHLHLDSTGSIIAQPEQLSTASTIYYYAPGNIDVGPLPVAEFISSKHDVTAIKHFLDVFNDKLRKITTKKIKKVETDFSLALIQSVCRALNVMTLSSYIQYMYEKYENKTLMQGNVTINHVCSSHFIKTVTQKIKKCYPDGKKQKLMRSIAASLLANIMHCNCVSAAAGVYDVFVKLFGNEYEDNDFNHLVKSIKIITEDVSTSSDIYSSQAQADTFSFDRKSLPYYHAFKTIEMSARENSKINYSKSNAFFCKEFFDYVTEYLMPYFPLWSATGIAQFNLSRDSNAPIENYFKTPNIR